MLTVDSIEVAYDKLQALFGVSFTVKEGEILCLMGRNGAGKTTTLKSIMGLLPVLSGCITLDDVKLSQLPAYEVPRHGIAYVPQGRGLFPELSVAQNLRIGLMVRKNDTAVREEALSLFPRLRERLEQRAETLSGGEQQMLAMARAMCMQPRLILLDEPTEGLQPSMIDLVRDVMIQWRERGVSIALVEQHVEAALAIADRVAFVENGRVPEIVNASTLSSDHEKVQQYLGIG